MRPWFFHLTSQLYPGILPITQEFCIRLFFQATPPAIFQANRRGSGLKPSYVKPGAGASETVSERQRLLPTAEFANIAQGA